jgi:hypothetical protein
VADLPRGRFSHNIRGNMVEQYFSGLKKKREGKVGISKAPKGGKTGKGQVFKNNLLSADLTGGLTTARKLKGSK